MRNDDKSHIPLLDKASKCRHDHAAFFVGIHLPQCLVQDNNLSLCFNEHSRQGYALFRIDNAY